MMPKFIPIQEWRIPEDAWHAAFDEMSVDGEAGNEGVMLWLGKRADGLALVHHSVILRGPGITKAPAFLQISASLMNEVADLSIELGLSLVGQIHSHGRGYGVGLSPTDHRYGIRFPYFLSVVAPDYARGSRSIGDCGVHFFDPEEGFLRFDGVKGSPIIRLTDGEPSVTVIGADNA